MNQTLELDLQRVRKRIKLLLAERYAFRTGAIAACVTILFSILSPRYFELGEPIVLIATVLTGVLAGAVWGLLRPLTPFVVARALERRLDLKERVSSAVALSSSSDDVVAALVDDAARHVGSVNPKEVFPHKFNRDIAAFCLAIIALSGIFFLPQMPAFQSKTRREEVKLMKEQGKDFQRIAKESLKQVNPSNKELIKRVALNMDRLGKKLESGRMSRKQAMLAMNKLSKDIKDTQDKVAAMNAASKPMSQADMEMKDAAKDLAKKMLDQLAKEQQDKGIASKQDPKMEELRKRLKDMQASSGPMSKSQMQKVERNLSQYMAGQKGANIPPELMSYMSELMKNGDYQKAMELMSELSKKLGSGQMSKMDSKLLEEQLKAMAKALQGTDMKELAKKLRESAEALAKMDPKEAAKLLRQAKNMQMSAQDLAKLGKMSGG